MLNTSNWFTLFLKTGAILYRSLFDMSFTEMDFALVIVVSHDVMYWFKFKRRCELYTSTHGIIERANKAQE